MSHNFLTAEDLRFVVTRLPKDVRELTMKCGIVIAGGFIRETIAGNKPKDIDVFASSREVLTLAADNLSMERDCRKIVTPNAITLLDGVRMPVQFITRWVFTNQKEIVESFDFTVCQAAVWFDMQSHEWKSVIGEGFYPDLAARRLVYTFPTREEEAGGSMMRVRKFLQRGYTIQANSLAGVIARIAGAVKWEQIPDEQQAAKVISGLLREVDPNITVDGLDPVDEHERLIKGDQE